MHNPIRIQGFSLIFPHKTCFENFSTQISFGDRIGVIGRNGGGKSSLLKMIAEKFPEISTARVPQIIEDFDSLSGGQRFNKLLSQALGKNPSMLLLDEPTNHLDLHNRKSLMRMLNGYYGTLIIATHDPELLRSCIDILWHIDDGKIAIFRGSREDCMNQVRAMRQSIMRQTELLEREKKTLHKNLMREQERFAKSKSSGLKKIADKKWMKSVGNLKGMKAEKAQGRSLKSIDEKKQKLSEQLSEIRLPEVISPKFHLPHRNAGDKNLVLIVDGSVGYADKIVLRNINLSINSQERLAVVGANGGGKTTLVRAISGDANIVKFGDWYTPNPGDVGYLDQHYGNLNPEKTAVEIISEANRSLTRAEIRRHLNDFLFRKNEEANTPVKSLSGGERARLSLAKIAASPPKLLILDEITNNIDPETRDHLTEILRAYPGAVIVVSHDEDFLDEIEITNRNAV
ncbi:MAG: ATP-binding cassette domain-containing protein [Holosporaceae bacterium]|jgi:ATPase subunit of ABC transporter with duplicated ATPase domains|nr:ATP-binding cassette domain-containing protein [Holosporaceae bacterium]